MCGVGAWLSWDAHAAQRLRPIRQDLRRSTRYPGEHVDLELRHQLQQSASGSTCGFHASKLCQRNDVLRMGDGELRIELYGFRGCSSGFLETPERKISKG